MANFYRDLSGWLSLLPAIAGLVVCVVYLRRSRWVPVLLGGFGLELLVAIFYRLATLGMMRGGMTGASFAMNVLAASMVGLLARFLVVGGLAGLLSDLVARPPAVAAADAPPAV